MRMLTMTNLWNQRKDKIWISIKTLWWQESWSQQSVLNNFIKAASAALLFAWGTSTSSQMKGTVQPSLWKTLGGEYHFLKGIGSKLNESRRAFWSRINTSKLTSWSQYNFGKELMIFHMLMILKMLLIIFKMIFMIIFRVTFQMISLIIFRLIYRLISRMISRVISRMISWMISRMIFSILLRLSLNTLECVWIVKLESYFKLKNGKSEQHANLFWDLQSPLFQVPEWWWH